MCCNIKYVKKYITVKIIKIDLINFERNFIGPSVPIKSKQNHATFGHLSNHNKDLSILCSYRYFSSDVGKRCGCKLRLSSAVMLSSQPAFQTLWRHHVYFGWWAHYQIVKPCQEIWGDSQETKNWQHELIWHKNGQCLLVR